jgi:hypothetical protein
MLRPYRRTPRSLASAPSRRVSLNISVPAPPTPACCVAKALSANCSAEDLERTAAGLFAANPALVAMMQNKLGSLVGRSSGYIESLPASVRRRVAGLKGVQKDHSKLEAEFQEEVLQLEKKYFAKFTPLYQTRAKIINGATEPSDEQVKVGEEMDDEDEDDEEKPETELNKDEGKDVKGIPEFWLSAMKNQISLAEMITDRDEAALKALTDIRMEYLDRPGFRLIFEFDENEYFSNKSITKTYFYQEENGYGGDFIYDHAEGDKIEWKAGKDLTVRIESKKQRNKSELSHYQIVSPQANKLQIPSRRALSRRLFLLSLSSTSSTHPTPHRTRMMLRPTSRSASSSTTSSVRTSRRSSSRVPLTGSPARLYNTRTSRTSMRASSKTRTMRTRTSSATTVTRMRSQTTRYDNLLQYIMETH